MSKDYDIVGAFQEIEEILIDSMMKNISRHKQWEDEEGFNWSMWQAEQLKSLQAYRKANKKQFKGYFSTINEQVELMLRKAYAVGGMEQEIDILKAIKRGYKPFKISDSIKEFIKEYKGKSLKDIATDIISRIRGRRTTEINGEFFKINDRKLDALIKATKNDFKKAEIAMLRMANDQYRKIIFNAQVYANTGAGTIEKAIDMASKDFLSKGINCIEYKNGARVNIKDYVSMAIRTANKRAYLQGEGAKRQEWGISTVIIVKRGAGCPKCTPFQGRVFIDDVWSGGKSSDGPYPLLSTAISAGLYHPNCKDTHTTYFEGVSSKPSPPSKEEQQRAIETYNIQQKEKYAERMVRKYDNLEQYSLDSENVTRYKNKKLQWQKIKNNLDELTRKNPPIKLKEIKSKYREELLDIIKDAPEVVRNVTLNNIDYICFAKTNTYGGNRYNKKYGMFVNLKKSSIDKRGKWTSVFHEMGHNMDNILGNVSHKNTRFREALINDFDNIVKSYKKVYNCSIEEAYKNIGMALKKETFHSVSDIIGGITNNKCRGRYGHFGKGYWNKPYSLEKESFAHFYEAYIRNDTEKIKVLSEMFPTANQEFLALLR